MSAAWVDSFSMIIRDLIEYARRRTAAESPKDYMRRSVEPARGVLPYDVECVVRRWRQEMSQDELQEVCKALLTGV